MRSLLLFISVLSISCLNIWRGSVLKYNALSLNDLKVNKPTCILYNITYYKTLYNIHNTENLLQRYNPQFIDCNIILFVPKSSVLINFFNQIDYIFKTIRYIITTNYTYNHDFVLELNNIKIYNLINYTSKYPKLVNNNIKIKKNGISTKINTYNNRKIINYNYKFNYEYFFNNSNRIHKFLNNNILISLPKKINEFKPFTLIYGFYIQEFYYIQTHLNYNANNELYEIEHIEYLL